MVESRAHETMEDAGAAAPGALRRFQLAVLEGPDRRVYLCKLLMRHGLK